MFNNRQQNVKYNQPILNIKRMVVAAKVSQLTVRVPQAIVINCDRLPDPLSPPRTCTRLHKLAYLMTQQLGS